jgi:hypothetical protein
MDQFRRFLDDMVLNELHLSGHLFTWSNERSQATLEQINQMFISNRWEEKFPRCDLRALSSHYSYHVPLLLCMDLEPSGKQWFLFRAFWPKCIGFLDVVQRVWHCSLRNASPFSCLDWLSRNMTHFLKSWSD